MWAGSGIDLGLPGRQPDVEQRVEVRAVERLREVDELPGRDVAAGLGARPCLQDPEEVPVTDLLTQSLEGHCAARVDGELEQGVRPRVADRQAPEELFFGRDLGEGVEDLRRGAKAL